MTHNQLALLLVLQVATCMAGGKYFVRDNANNPFDETDCASEERQSSDTVHHQEQIPKLQWILKMYQQRILAEEQRPR